MQLLIVGRPVSRPRCGVVDVRDFAPLINEPAGLILSAIGPGSVSREVGRLVTFREFWNRKGRPGNGAFRV